jgi:hypothetical protein
MKTEKEFFIQAKALVSTRGGILYQSENLLGSRCSTVYPQGIG